MVVQNIRTWLKEDVESERDCSSEPAEPPPAKRARVVVGTTSQPTQHHSLFGGVSFQDDESSDDDAEIAPAVETKLVDLGREIERYEKTVKILPNNAAVDVPLKWWREHAMYFPMLSKIA